MKKYIIVLILLIILPIKVCAASIETSFNEDNCTLTVSGTNTGHEATISMFNKDKDLIGFKTGEINNGNYSVDFVLTYEHDETIDITLSNENGGSETIKNDVAISACQRAALPAGKVNELFDSAGNSIIINDNTIGFEASDRLSLETQDKEQLYAFADELSGTMFYDNYINLLNSFFKELGDYRSFMFALDVHVMDDHNVDIDYSNYNKGFILNLALSKDEYKALSGIRFVYIDKEKGKLASELETTYDSENEILVVNLDKLDTIIVYIDNDYEYLDGTGDLTYKINKDDKLIFRINALKDKFVNLYIDSKLVSASNYTVKSGSTVITLKKEYLDSLSEGKHTIKANFNDGKAETTFEVKKESSLLSNLLNPKTGDNIRIWFMIFGISFIGLVFALSATKSKNKQ